MGTTIVIAVLLALLAAAGFVGYEGWIAHSEVEVPGYGYAAMWAGIALSIVVGCGLMALVFYSSRMGYDEPAQRDVEGERRRDRDRQSAE